MLQKIMLLDLKSPLYMDCTEHFSTIITISPHMINMPKIYSFGIDYYVLFFSSYTWNYRNEHERKK